MRTIAIYKLIWFDKRLIDQKLIGHYDMTEEEVITITNHIGNINNKLEKVCYSFCESNDIKETLSYSFHIDYITIRNMDECIQHINDIVNNIIK